MVWTRFMDMASGGGSKEAYAYIYIEAPESEAITIFYNRFDHNPERVTCTCCGDDYSISESETLEQATAYERGCGYENGAYVESADTGSYRKYQPLEDYLASTTEVLLIRADEIQPGEREGTVPLQGFIWQE